MTDRAGVVVAGGRSTRMGDREKAVLKVGGRPLVARVADALAAVADELVVNCRADQREAIAAVLADRDPAFAIDADPDRGPVAGVETGLRATDADYAAVVACDMPFLDPGLLRYLFERAAGHEAAVPKPAEWFEPLHAVYRPEQMAAACENALAEGEPRLVEPVFSLDFEVVERADLLAHGTLASFESVDTPADLRDAADRLE
ncbi:molybdenum cofactor guanylyltransferase [Natronomonas marina]|jgi:molybdopterin-guanine dinucleotide biosynthesis protein A|uniref:molybdenum cofactor guanylyltransferase n=1 Tax=Natronomonas marina TaxID=2961939 RepID=UPI0020C9BAF4|nr:molybdenum cofactor guanylyltransferase [Natronomonas marina]